jgi:hypothetical protein
MTMPGDMTDGGVGRVDSAFEEYGIELAASIPTNFDMTQDDTLNSDNEEMADSVLI